MVGQLIGITRLLKVGTQNRLTIPKDIVEFYNIKEGQNIQIEFKALFNDGDVIQPIDEVYMKNVFTMHADVSTATVME